MTAPLPPDAALPARTERGPVRTRAPLPDVLRGLALLGILVVNAQDFAGFREWTQTGLDRAVQVLTDVLANGRFISIFAMLFGWGAAGLLQKQGLGVFARRHLVLLAVGSLHFMLVWHGDIISLYAVLAFGLLATARMTARGLLTLAAVLGAWWLGLGLLEGFAARAQGLAAPRFTGLPSLFSGETYTEVVSGRAADFLSELIGSSLYNGAWLLALFCLGAAAGRVGLLLRPHEHVRLLRGLTIWGLLIGLPLGVLLAWLNTRGDYASGLIAIPVRMGGGLASALGYVGVIGLLTVHDRLGPLRVFAAGGRVAMSNYITQSLIMTAIFYPYAGAQFGQWDAAAAVGLALVLGLLQLPVSAWWLRRFGTGPLEWLVRRLVYWK
ncbi:DUF418 domain-containing protein [Deinococcus humi]|uniref:DUF418 domain-containing protein n=1 Tax=Deinococcus humi TaxID=662880 RepID=A0A7W8JTZ6_9DEIO|nr:DUF418 domain-containing protein [Deinococcus humi]MBB5361629.1 uncharacterized protein [Deinococcus humi]GGO21026.1 hypothetical protein GCM10008949_06850 [Deinococcus humi]